MKTSSIVLIISAVVSPLLGLAGLWVLISSQPKRNETEEIRKPDLLKFPIPTPDVF